MCNITYSSSIIFGQDNKNSVLILSCNKYFTSTILSIILKWLKKGKSFVINTYRWIPVIGKLHLVLWHK